MGILPVCMSVQHLHDLCLRRPEKGVGSAATAVTDGLGHRVSVRTEPRHPAIVEISLDCLVISAAL